MGNAAKASVRIVRGTGWFDFRTVESSWTIVSGKYLPVERMTARREFTVRLSDVSESMPIVKTRSGTGNRFFGST